MRLLQPCSYRQAARHETGFTLIEILVVLVIIGVVLTFATLSINPSGPADRLDTESQRLLALSQAAADDAILYGKQIGLQIVPGGYRFLRLGPDGWKPIGGDTPLRERQLGDDLYLTDINQGDAKKGRAGALTLADSVTASSTPTSDGSGSASGTNGNGDDDDDQKKQDQLVHPDAMFLSSGEMLPFTLELSARGVGHRFDLTGDESGQLDLKRVGND